MGFSRASAWLAAVLIAAPAWSSLASAAPVSGLAQTPPAQAQPPAQQPQEPTVTSPSEAQPQAGDKAQDGRKSRRKQRTPRTSSRQKPLNPRGSFEEARVSRSAGPTRQELTLSSNVQGGYDDNLTGGTGAGSSISPLAMASGSSAYFDARLDYFAGNNHRSVKIDGMGTLQHYPAYLKKPAAGGSTDISASAMVGRALTFRGSERVGYAPYFNPLAGLTLNQPLASGAAAGVDSGVGLYERRSVSSSSSVSMDTRWSRSDWTSLSYTYGLSHFTDDSYGGSRTQNARAEYRHVLTPGVRARTQYSYSDRQYDAFDGTPLPTYVHRVEAGPDIEQTLSRRRSFKLSFLAGAALVKSMDSKTRTFSQDWVPVGSADATLGLSPSWSVGAQYRREFSQLRSIIDDVYTTDTASVSTSGQVTSRIALVVAGTYSNWKSPYVAGVTGKFDIYGGSVRLRFAVSGNVATTVDYSYYRHVYSNPGELPAGFPAKYNRDSVRVGVMLWLPLAGAASPGPPAGR